MELVLEFVFGFGFGFGTAVAAEVVDEAATTSVISLETVVVVYFGFGLWSGHLWWWKTQLIHGAGLKTWPVSWPGWRMI